MTESDEQINLSLSNPGSGCTLGEAASATITVVDNDAASQGQNPIGDAAFFVREHYHDFLNREPDDAGLNFWTGEIEGCGTDTSCREVKRINVSGAFFLSIRVSGNGLPRLQGLQGFVQRRDRQLDLERPAPVPRALHAFPAVDDRRAAYRGAASLLLPTTRGSPVSAPSP